MKLDTIKFIGLLTILLCFAARTTTWAQIDRVGGVEFCNLCHEEGNGGGGKPLLSRYQGPEGCVECHSHDTSSTTYTMSGGGQEVIVPVVVFTGASAPTEYLDGGNFWWVKEGNENADDTKGHNIFPGEGDDYLSGAPGNQNGLSCGGDLTGCHENLHVASTCTFPGLNGKWGCTGCHMVYDFTSPSHIHHADDTQDDVVGFQTADDDGYFRFLFGHQAGSGHGVCGIEDDDWQSTSSTDHNEYLGYQTSLNAAGNLSLLGHTVTGFCSGCHGSFHISSDFPTGGDWIRHVSGAILPNEGEFASYTTFDPDTPVARPSLSSVSSTVTPGTDLVNCLSCHRAHGSPYPKMLRWDMTDTTQACSTCHTNLKKE